jgi:hypothetical protein
MLQKRPVSKWVMAMWEVGYFPPNTPPPACRPH